MERHQRADRSDALATPSHSAVPLTRAELQILRRVARGESNQAIAQELVVTRKTVEFHLQKLYRKSGARNRQELRTWAWTTLSAL